MKKSSSLGRCSPLIAVQVTEEGYESAVLDGTGLRLLLQATEI
jgi:hypothetical protein